MATTNGLIGAADIIKTTDAFIAPFNLIRPILGISAETETGTLSALSQTTKDTILGNGSSLYGIGSAEVQAALKGPLNYMITHARWDDYLTPVCQQVFSALDTHITQNLPTGWTFNSAGGRGLDLWATRLNANSTSTPAAPTGTVTITAVTGGSIPACASGEVHLKLTYVGASHWLESLPSSDIVAPAIAGVNSAYTVAVSGNVPAGVTAVRVYRSTVAGASGSLFYSSQIGVTAGAAHPTITVSEPDSQLRKDISPPSWGSCMFYPEAAALYAMTWSPSTAKIGTLTTQAMMSPRNVYSQPVTGFLGVGNTAATATLASRVVGSTLVSGSVQASNVAANGIQGFAGGLGAQVKVTATLNASGSITSITYWYLSAANPSVPASGTISGPIVVDVAIGSTADLGIPAGRICTSVTADTCGGAASGTYVYESKGITR